MTKLVKFSNDLVELLSGIDFLKAINSLSSGWGNLNINDATSLEAFLADGTARLRTPETKAAADLSGLGSAYATVIDVIDHFSSLTGGDPGQAILRLLSRVDRYDDEGGSDPRLVRLPVISVAADGGSGPLSVNISGKAAIEFEAGDAWPYRRDWGDDPGLAGLVRIQVDGEAQAGAGAISFPGSRLRVIAVIDDMATYLGAAFPNANARRIPRAFAVIDGEPT